MVTSLGRLLNLMRDHGAHRIYAKCLSPNDNSKNQVYLGGDFAALNIIPHGEVYTDSSEKAGSVRDRAKADVEFYWVNEEGMHRAPNANLILYPQYPEVRMSGFLKGCETAPSKLLTVRDKGRAMFFGVTRDGGVLGYVTDADNPITKELVAGIWPMLGIFIELPLSLEMSIEPKTILLDELRRIYQLNWIMSQKLTRDGTKAPYAAPNGGGYTLEAELGISPNGYAAPDFMGWEVKQYGVNNFQAFKPKSPVTLMTPEPTGGIYKTEGIAEFMKRFGYSDQRGRQDRFNFGGHYDCTRTAHHRTGLRMTLTGYDAANDKITDINGGMVLLNAMDEVAASWTFKGLMAHWNRKHAQAAYVPSLSRNPPPEYCYGRQILLCEQTDFLLFLKAFSKGKVYYDPGIKIEKASSTNPSIKRRSQFRVKHANLTQLYHQNEIVLLL